MVQYLRLHFECRGHGFDPWSRNLVRSHVPHGAWLDLCGHEWDKVAEEGRDLWLNVGGKGGVTR